MSIDWQTALERLHHSEVSEAKRWGMSDEQANLLRGIIAARVAELEAENSRLREALEAAAHWHDSERKALGKQPPNTDRDWRRTQHSLQAEEIRANLEVARPTAPAPEQEEG